MSKATKQTGPTTTTFIDVTYDQQDEIATADFGHTNDSADITLKTAGLCQPGIGLHRPWPGRLGPAGFDRTVELGADAGELKKAKDERRTQR